VLLGGNESDQWTIFAVSPDLRRLASASKDGRVELWDLTAPFPIHPTVLAGRAGPSDSRDPSGPPVALAFDVRSEWLIAGTADKRFRLWSLGGKEATTAKSLRGLDGDVIEFLVSSDGRRLVVGAKGGVRVWDLGEPGTNPVSLTLGGVSSDIALPGFWARVVALAFGPRDESVVAIYDDQTVHVWTLDRKTLLEKAARVAGRNFTLAEWEQFFPGGDPYRKTFDVLPVPPARTPTSVAGAYGP
jgi:WD40 repeat protein